MKRFILLSFFLCLVKIVDAQTEKGNFLIGGSASFKTNSNDNSDSQSFSLSPNISYFFADRFAAGIITPLSLSKSSEPSISVSSTSYAIGPTVRYYFPISEQWAIFPQLDYTYQWSDHHADFPSGSTDTKSTASVFRINAGITYFITRNIGLEGILYYQNTNGESTLTVASGFDYGIRFGLQIYLLRTKELH